MRTALVFALLSTLAIAPSVARADAPAKRIARVLGTNMEKDASGRVPLVARLPKGVDARSLDLLDVAPGFGAIRLLPSDIDAFEASHPGVNLLWSPPRMPLLDVSKKWTRVDTFRSETGATGKGVIVGVVDTGLDIRHADFLDASGKTRVRWMLVAGAPAGIHADVESQAGCDDPNQGFCAVYDNTDIDAMNAKGDMSIVDSDGHGTHVTSIAAGNGGISKTKKPIYVGMAPDATIIVAAPEPAGGGFYDPDILRATKFIFDRADELGMPCVVNLSVGGDFGPHDGTSSIEQGLEALVGDDKPGRAIVVAAGNSGALYTITGEAISGPFGIHTEAHVAPDTDVRVPILAGASNTGTGYVWITFQPSDDVSVALEGPKGKSWVGSTSPGHDTGYKNGGDTAGVINNEVTSDSSIEPGTNSAVVTFSGSWDDLSEFAVHLSGNGTAELWLTGTGDVGPDADIGVLFEKAMKQGTINEPASAPNLIGVGCTLNRLSWKPLGLPEIALSELGGVQVPKLMTDSLCYFSSAGPTPAGVIKPELVAPGGFVAAAMSADADPRTHPGSIFDEAGCPTSAKCYVVDDTHAITIGTSMSAPHVTGAIALLFQLEPTLTQAQVTEVLQAGAHYPEGGAGDEQQLGPGELDMEGARAALANKETYSGEPDVTKSWFTLGSEYARPDASWPVEGVIELRRADGSIASGIDGTKLELHVDNGVVLHPVTKVRRGLFTFDIAGAKGMAGSELTLDVSYDGMSIGSRTIPIGDDVWEGDSAIDATSGACACRIGERESGAGGWIALLASAIVTSRRRNSWASRSKPPAYCRCTCRWSRR